jgi:hypothetical protein
MISEGDRRTNGCSRLRKSVAAAALTLFAENMMIKYKQMQKMVEEPEAVICDVCKGDFAAGDLESKSFGNCSAAFRLVSIFQPRNSLAGFLPRTIEPLLE